MLAAALHLRGQEMSLRDIAARLVIATGKKKGQHPSPATALEEQRSEKYQHALIAVVSIGVRAGQLGGTATWLSSRLVSHA